jgi:hypothetical protein
MFKLFLIKYFFVLLNKCIFLTPCVQFWNLNGRNDIEDLDTDGQLIQIFWSMKLYIIIQFLPHKKHYLNYKDQVINAVKELFRRSFETH